MKRKSVAIIGMGRFGKTLYRLLHRRFRIVAWDSEPSVRRSLRLGAGDSVARTLKEAFACDTIFYAVPISKFAKVLRSHRIHFRPEHLLIDTLSVKLYPARVFAEVLGNRGASPRALLTHPLFGPDSSQDGFKGLPLVIDRFTSRPGEYAFWHDFFKAQGLRVMKMKPAVHDRLAADSQGVTHFTGRLLEESGFKPTNIDTLGAKKLQELHAQVCMDTWQLFFDLQTYNPYTPAMRARLGRAYNRLYGRLLPRQVRPDIPTFGIQGGRGSFSEQALQEYAAKHKIRNYETKYLFTSERVLRHLHEGHIDLGLFAMQNAAGGTVRESIIALSHYNCRIRGEFPILVRHFLMRRKDNALRTPKKIMAHEQVFRQCARTLANRYPRAKLITGKGDLLDTARAAQALAAGTLPKETFILGPRPLAAMYGLEITDRDLQDDRRNYTTFLLVSRP